MQSYRISHIASVFRVASLESDDLRKPRGTNMRRYPCTAVHHTLDGSSGRLAQCIEPAKVIGLLIVFCSRRSRSFEAKMAFAMTDKLGALKQVGIHRIIDRVSVSRSRYRTKL